MNAKLPINFSRLIRFGANDSRWYYFKYTADNDCIITSSLPNLNWKRTIPGCPVPVFELFRRVYEIDLRTMLEQL